MKGRRLLPLAAVAVAALAFPALANAKAFTLGVSAGEITASSAKVWAHATKKGKTYAEVAEDKRFKDIVKTKRVKAKSSNDFTVQATIKKLDSGEQFYYHFCTAPTESKDDGKGKAATASKKKSGRQKCSKRGIFETAPPATANETIRFAFTGDTDGTPLPGQSTPFWGDFAVYGQMINEKNDFNINFGDTIYSDSSIGGGPPALTVEEKWVKYRQNLSVADLPSLRRSAGFYSHWDDHEFINDFSIPEDGQAIYEAGVKAFADYAPVSYSSETGLYRSFRWGANLELFFLDERSFRNAKVSATDVCDNPSTGAPDLAPTAPQSVRSVFSLVIPSLANPVSQECLDQINDPNRTMLGQRQYNAFVDAVKSSNAKFKIIMNETPIQQFYGLPYDRWEGYAHERVALLRELEEGGVRNVVFLTTDTHASFANVIRYRTLANDSAPANAPAGQPPLDTPYDDYIVGPVATNPFWPEIDEITGTPGSGRLISEAFFKPAPPNGVGMFCSQGNVDSYAEVEVSAAGVTISYKDQTGQTIQDVDGQPCGPYTIPAQ
jgi:phosphodiesterase/alkaline phosphatase D-like protein